MEAEYEDFDRNRAEEELNLFQKKFIDKKDVEMLSQ